MRNRVVVEEIVDAAEAFIDEVALHAETFWEPHEREEMVTELVARTLEVMDDPKATF